MPGTFRFVQSVISTLLKTDEKLTQFNRNGRSFVMPDIGFGPIVMIPQEHISWLIAQPEHVLSARIPQSARIGIKYTLPSLDFSHGSFHVDIREILTRNLDKLQKIVFEDMRKTIDMAFGPDSDLWHEIHLFNTMESVISSSLNRVIVGQPLCSNKRYLRSQSSLLKWLGGSFVVVGQLMPPILKPVLGYLAAIPIYYYRRKTMSYLVPLIKAQASSVQREEVGLRFKIEEPQSVLSWMVAASLEGDNPPSPTPEAVATNMIFLVSICLYPSGLYQFASLIF